MENRAKISIVVPVFNNDNNIQETIVSIKQQTYQNWEAIFVDDGSEDNSAEIIKETIRDDGRFLFLFRDREPKGGSTCRNIGLEASKGDYVIFLDGDDLLAENCLKNRIEIIDNTDYDFAVFPMATFKDDVKENRILTRFDVRDVDYYYITGSSIWQVTSPIYRTSFIKGINGFDERFSRMQDIELGLRSVVLSKGNFKMLTASDLDCFYRIPVGPVAVASKKYIKTLESYVFMLETIYDLHQQGYLKNRYKYSIGLLATYCRILQVIDILKIRKESVGSFFDYNKIDLRPDLLWYHGLILSLLTRQWLPTKLHLKVVHFCDQYCRWHFLK